MMGFIAERDIGAQETCHMLQKLPLVICSRTFVSLNVSKKILHRINNSQIEEELSTTYIHSYTERPQELHSFTLFQTAQMYSYSSKRRKNQWQKRKNNAIVNVYPLFQNIPDENNDTFETFCWTELLLYKPFRHITIEISITKDEIVTNWKSLQPTNYIVFHINRVQNIPTAEPEDDTDNDDLEILEDPDLYEWELLSQMGASNNLNIDDLDMLGKRDIDINYSWNTNNIFHQLDESTTTFISKGKLDTSNTISFTNNTSKIPTLPKTTTCIRYHY